MSVCSLDKLASIDIPAGRNSGIFGLLAESVTETAQFYESKFEFWFEAASAFNRSQILTSRPRIERAAFSLGVSYHIICDTLPREANHEMRAIAPQKILAFLLGTSIFYPYKFSGTEPSNFCDRGVELLIRLVLSLCCQT